MSTKKYKFHFLLVIIILLVMLFGCAKTNNIKIHFETNGGSNVPSLILEDGETFTIPSEPSKAGYVFEGWFFDSTFEKEVTVTSILEHLIDNEVIRYAKWMSELELQLKEIYLLTINAGAFNGTYEEWLEAFRGPQDVPGEDGISAYEKYLENYPDYKGTEEKWIIDLIYGNLNIDGFVEIDFDNNGGTIVEPQTIKKYTTIIKPQDPEKEGYEFLYWSYLNNPWIFYGYFASTNITLKANYDLISYDISYILDGGFNNEQNPDTYTIENDTFTLLDPEKEGYTFVGWTFIGQDVPLKNPTIENGSLGDLEFSAHWYQLNESQYNSENTIPDDHGILDTLYALEIFDDETFVFVTITLYSNGDLISVAEAGTIYDLTDGLYRLDFSSEIIEPLYIIIEEDAMYFSDEAGNILDGNFGNNGDGITDDPNIEYDSFGYGYINLLSLDNGVKMQKLYEDLYQLNVEFNESTTNFENINNDFLFMTIDCEDYELLVDDVLKTVKVFKLDYPEFYWLSNTTMVEGSRVNLFLIEVYASNSHKALVDQAIQIMIDDLESLIDNTMGELMVTKIIHDYLIDRVDYSYEEDGITPENDYWAHNIEGVALGTGAVCEAYAEAFDYLLEYFGINSILITGQSNSDNHMWNLVSIDGVYYFFDVTWDDKGEKETSYAYFGGSFEFFAPTHTFDQSSSLGVDFLYDLPSVSTDVITLVKLYENDLFIDYFVSIDHALDRMDNQDSDYVLSFHSYESYGPILWSSSVREYSIKNTIMPTVKSITFLGDHINLGNGYFTASFIYLNDHLIFNSDVILRNMRFYNKKIDEVEFNIGNHTLNFEGYHNQFGSNILIIGSLGSVINSFVEYENEIYASIDINIMNLYGPIVLRGLNNSIVKVNQNNLNGYLRVYGEVKSLTIKDLYLFQYSAILNLDNVINTVVNIENIHNYPGAHANDKSYIIVRLSDIANIPIINITGSLDNIKLQYWFMSTISYVSTDLDGNEINRWEVETDLREYIHRPILYAPNLPYENFYFRLSNDYDFKELFDKDLDGNFSLERLFYEEIVNNELIKVISWDDDQPTEYVVPNGVTAIKAYALSNYLNLTNIVFPDSLITIETYGLFGLNGITEVYLPTSLTTIEEFGIYGLSKLISIYIPLSVKNMGMGAITYCNEAIIYVEATEKPIGWVNEWNYQGGSPVEWGYTG